MKISQKEISDLTLRGGSKNFKLIAENEIGNPAIAVTQFIIENKRTKKLFAFEGEHDGNFNYEFDDEIYEVEAEIIERVVYVRK